MAKITPITDIKIGFNTTLTDGRKGIYNRNAGGTISNGVSTILTNWNTSLAITGFDATTGVFTAPRNMSIIVSAAILMHNVGSGTFSTRPQVLLTFVKNGGISLFGDVNTLTPTISEPNWYANNGLTPPVITAEWCSDHQSGLIHLNQGDTITLNVLHNAGVGTTWNIWTDANFNYLHLTEVL